STRLRHLRTTTATAARDLRSFAYPITGFEAHRDQIVADGRDERDLVIFCRGEQDAIAAGPLLQRIHRGAELLVVAARDFADDEFSRAERRCALEKFSRSGDRIDFRD